MLDDQKLARIFLVLGFLLALTIGFSYTYDTATPVGTDAPSVIDDRIREVKAAIQERMNVDHYWPLTGTQVSDTDAGYHKSVHFYSSTAADPILNFTTVSGIDELQYTDSASSAIQITSAGYLNGSAMLADSVDEDAVQLDNDSYLTAANQAGDGTVNLIKANTSDVAVIPDGSELATSAAPTADADIANKKYVDDNITTYTQFGTWASKSNTTVYQASSDGFIVAYGTTGPSYVYTGSANPPTSVRAVEQAVNFSVCVPVKRDEYYKTTGTWSAIYWLPIGQ